MLARALGSQSFWPTQQAAALEIKTNPPNDDGEDENEGSILQ
jgi:hypothetical protein